MPRKPAHHLCADQRQDPDAGPPLHAGQRNGLHAAPVFWVQSESRGMVMALTEEQIESAKRGDTKSLVRTIDRLWRELNFHEKLAARLSAENRELRARIEMGPEQAEAFFGSRLP